MLICFSKKKNGQLEAICRKLGLAHIFLIQMTWNSNMH